MIRKVPLNAKVMCTDGLAGESISVVIHPETRRITHLVVQDRNFSKALEWLVPMEMVQDATSEVIRLYCTCKELSKMQPFKQEHYLEQEFPEFSGYNYAYSQPVITAPAGTLPIPIEELNIAVEELALNRGTDVQATDGYLGQIGEILLDPKSDEISHFILKRGHLWGKKEVVIPLSYVDHADPDTVYLKMEKEAIDKLPSIPLNRPWKEVDATDLDLMVWSFDGVELAEAALDALKALERNNQITLLNVALITKGTDGKVSLREIKEVDTRRGTVTGAIAGGLAGLLIGPGGAIIGAAVGAAAGRNSARRVEVGVSKDKLQAIQEDIPKGSSALVLIIEHRWYATVRQAIARFDHDFIHQRLTDVSAQESGGPGEEQD
jgi:uncharacterized membrane protein/sporulation protein YlmC with PRC-barrel domain